MNCKQHREWRAKSSAPGPKKRKAVKNIEVPMFDKWDYRFMRVALNVATWSKDPVEGVGALLVSPSRKSVSWGFNGFPRGVYDTEERLKDRVIKNDLVVHAELNAILNCQLRPEAWTLYCTKHPCAECAKAAIQAGVTRIVCLPYARNSRRLASYELAVALLQEAGVVLCVMLHVYSPDDLEDA